MDSNYLGWSSAMAPVIMGNADRPELGAGADQQLLPGRPGDRPRSSRASTFLSDNRADLVACPLPSLVLQCADDAIAPEAVGEYMHGSCRQPVGAPACHRSLPEPQRAGGDHRRDSRLPRRVTPQRAARRAPRSSMSRRPAATSSPISTGRSSGSTRRSRRWTGLRREELVGRLRFPDLLTRGGRIYYETHYAPFLIMQGSVREIAFEIRRADGNAAARARQLGAAPRRRRRPAGHPHDHLRRHRPPPLRGASCSRPTAASRRSRSSCSGACWRRAAHAGRGRARGPLPPAGERSRSAATGTTPSGSTDGASAWSSATSSAAASRPPRRWGSCAAPCGRSPRPAWGRRAAERARRLRPSP